MLMTDQQAELTKPGIGPLDDPATFVTPEFAAILVAPLFVVAAVRNDQFYVAFFQPFAQRVRVAGAVGVCCGRDAVAQPPRCADRRAAWHRWPDRWPHVRVGREPAPEPCV